MASRVPGLVPRSDATAGRSSVFGTHAKPGGVPRPNDGVDHGKKKLIPASSIIHLNLATDTRESKIDACSPDYLSINYHLWNWWSRW